MEENVLKYSKKDFEKYLETINRQIKDIEKLVNEFSNFARMPRPIFKQINIIDRLPEILKAIPSIKDVVVTNYPGKRFLKF